MGAMSFWHWALVILVVVLLFGLWPAPMFDMMNASVDQLVTQISHSKLP